MRAGSTLKRRAEHVVVHWSHHIGPDLGHRDLQAHPSAFSHGRPHVQAATHAARALSHQRQPEVALTRTTGIVDGETRAVVRDNQAQLIVLELNRTAT